MKKRALITGITGQDGAYLAKLLLSKDYEVYGIVRPESIQNYANLEFLEISNRINYITADLTDQASITKAVKDTKPDELYNLGAMSFVGVSWDITEYTTNTNSMGVIYLLNAIRTFAPKCRFYQASTSEMFGNVDDFQTENTPFKPINPYGVSKLFSHHLVNIYRQSYSLHCSAGILFNHESPIRGKQFVTRKITEAVAKIKLGLTDEIQLGNLDSKRDWGFAGDYVEAMWLMLQQDIPSDYVVATGVNHSIRELLTVAFNVIGIKEWDKYVKINPEFYRPIEINNLKGDSSKIQKLGWKPKTSFVELITTMVEQDLLTYKNNNNGQ